VHDRGFSPDEIDTGRPHPARMYDYYLGGRDNYAVDRRAADRIIEDSPGILASARANRAFLHRAVRTVVEGGIRQILDVGTGIPTSPNTHEVARQVAADTRVVYVDNDPIVATHAGAKLTNTRGTGFALGDVREPAKLLESPEVRRLIDFGQPVALLLVAVLHFVTDEEDPAGIVAALTDPLPAGSALVLTHGTRDLHHPDRQRSVADEVYQQSTASLNLRSHARVLSFFDGLTVLDPGLVQAPLWRPDAPSPADEELSVIGIYGGVGAKP
jgi:hypothetical protein